MKLTYKNADQSRVRMAEFAEKIENRITTSANVKLVLKVTTAKQVIFYVKSIVHHLYHSYYTFSEIVHPCIPDPCQFGGTCYNHTETTYSCGCPLNRTGSQCEEGDMFVIGMPTFHNDTTKFGYFRKFPTMFVPPLPKWRRM